MNCVNFEFRAAPHPTPHTYTLHPLVSVDRSAKVNLYRFENCSWQNLALWANLTAGQALFWSACRTNANKLPAILPLK
ncbi:MAG: hypothetical protein F6J93_14875 [Oscillatoria sp. SIO1A7]|nr:hypothetical protein [Oscillatoria sp. SIO1A7]